MSFFPELPQIDPTPPHSKGGLVHLLALDYLKEGLAFEQPLLNNDLGHGDWLPTQASLPTQKAIYANRLKTCFAYPFIVATRMTGLDLIIEEIEFYASQLKK